MTRPVGLRVRLQRNSWVRPRSDSAHRAATTPKCGQFAAERVGAAAGPNLQAGCISRCTKIYLADMSRKVTTVALMAKTRSSSSQGHMSISTRFTGVKGRRRHRADDRTLGYQGAQRECHCVADR